MLNIQNISTFFASLLAGVLFAASLLLYWIPFDVMALLFLAIGLAVVLSNLQSHTNTETGSEQKATGAIAFFLLLFAGWMAGHVAVYLYAQQLLTYDVWMPLQKQQGKWIVAGVWICALLTLLHKWQSCRLLWQQFWHTEELPYGLALFRILYFVANTPAYVHNIWNMMPRVAPHGVPLQPMEYTGWYVQFLPESHMAYAGACILAGGLGAMVCVGFMTRYALPVLTLLALYIWGMPNMYGKMNHNQIHVWIPLILSVSRCADVWSVDAWLSRRRGSVAGVHKSAAYWQPLAVVYMVFAVMYVFSGLRKIGFSGLAWALSPHFVYQIQQEWIENYFTLPAIRIDHYPVLAQAAGLGIVVLEIIYPLLILTPAGRWLACFGGLGLHKSARYFMNIGFEDLQWVYTSYFAPLVNKLYLARTEAATIAHYRLFKPVVFLLLALNTVFSIMAVHSWPFSPYPSYSALAPAVAHMVVLYGETETGHIISLDSLGKAIGFRKENFMPLENVVLQTPVQDTVLLQHNASQLWQTWKGYLPAMPLKAVHVYAVKFPVQPEKYDSIIERKWLTTIHP